MEPNKNESGKALRNALLVIGIPILLFFLMWMLIGGGRGSNDKDKQVYSDYIQYFLDDKVQSYTLDLGTGKLELTMREATRTARSTRSTC